MKSVTCQSCHHTWAPRTEKPQKCPKCGSRNWNKKLARRQEKVKKIEEMTE